MSTRRGHVAPTSCAAVSPDARSWVSGSYDRAVLVWDVASGRVMRELCGHGGLINAVAWSPDGQRIASASSDHSARIWDAASGMELTRLLGHTDDVNDVRWAPDGSRVATASFDGTVRVFGVDGRTQLIAGHHRSDVNGVAWFPDGQRLAAASDDGNVSVFDADGGRVRRILGGHGSWVDQVVIDPSGSRIATACLDGAVAIFDVANGARLHTLRDASCAVKAVTWSRDGLRLAAASYDGCVRIYSAQDFRTLAVWRAEGLWNRTLDFSANGIVTGSFGGGPVELGPAGTRQLGSPQTHGLNGFALRPDGRRLIACSDDGALYEVDLCARSVVGELGRHAAAVLAAAYSPDGRWLASSSWDRRLRIWDAERRICVAEYAGLGEPVNTLRFEPGGERVWIGTFNGEVASWDIAHARIEELGRHEGSVKCLDPCGERAVSSGRDGWIRAWSSGPVLSFPTGGSILNGVAVGRRSGRVATVSRRGGIELWSGTGRRLAAFTDHPCSAKSVHFAPDERRIAAAYYDGHLAVWEPKTSRTELVRVSEAPLSQVAFAGRSVIASAWDRRGSLHVLSTQPLDTLAVLSVAA